MKTNHKRSFIERFRPKLPNKYIMSEKNTFADKGITVYYKEGGGNHQYQRAKKGMKDAMHRLRRLNDRSKLRDIKSGLYDE